MLLRFRLLLKKRSGSFLAEASIVPSAVFEGILDDQEGFVCGAIRDWLAVIG